MYMYTNEPAKPELHNVDNIFHMKNFKNNINF